MRTSGGVWEDEKFVLLPGINDKTARGADMTLSFTPEFPVSATEIGLVQTVKTIKNGELYFLKSETVEARSIPDGTSIDQRPDNRNPVYATPGVDDSQIFGENGHHFVNSVGWHTKKAWLRDTPHLRGLEVGEKASSQVFEVAALALQGNQKGSYYGSVKWGWELTEAGVHRLIPLQLVSQTNPSSTFLASAAQWNKTATSLGQSPLKLPIPLPEKAPVEEVETVEKVESSAMSTGSNCFLTTACVRSRGLPDDCEELTILRAFRDGFLSTSPEGRSLIQRYYRIAPGLVAAIDSREDAEAVYEGIYGTVTDCVAAVREGRFDVALDLYTEMVLGLEAELSYHLPHALHHREDSPGPEPSHTAAL